MSSDIYRRYNPKERQKEKKINNQELIFGITQKDLFKQEMNPLNRLTGNRGTSHSMPKNKNTIIHSNSTNLLNKAIKNNQNSNLKENNYNIININVNNLIINNNNNNKDVNNINNIHSNNNKVFSKIGNEIIDGKNLLNNEIKKNKGQKKSNKGSASVQKKLPKERYEPLSNIQGVINNLMEVTKSPPPPFDNNLKLNNISPIINDLNKNSDNTSINSNNNNKENRININIDEKIMEIHFNLWEILINMELHAENKIGLSNQVKKLLNFMETEILNNNSNNNNIKNICDIFNNNQLNLIYNKTIKISFILATYIKFIILDFNFINNCFTYIYKRKYSRKLFMLKNKKRVYRNIFKIN